jgi:hypothetical protein
MKALAALLKKPANTTIDWSGVSDRELRYSPDTRSAAG